MDYNYNADDDALLAQIKLTPKSQADGNDDENGISLDGARRLMMSDRRPNNRGVLIGRVQKLNKDHTKAVVKLDKTIHAGDGLEFWVKVGGRVGTVVNGLRVNGAVVETAAAGTSTPQQPNTHSQNARSHRQSCRAAAHRYSPP